MNAAAHSIEPNASWHAQLRLRFAATAQRTVLAERQHIGPLVVQRPFYPEGDVCHVYLIHPPGGVAGGDHLQLDVLVDANAHAVITTPAATKFYRAAPNRIARVQQSLRVRDACLEWLPQEAIVFNRADVATLTRFDIDANSKLLAWELTCYGRLASNEPFDGGRIRQGLELWRDGKPVLLDHLRINGGSDMQRAPWGLHGMSALGTLLAYPAQAADVEAVRECVEVNGNLLSCTLIDGVLLCRCLCADSAALKLQLLKVWQCLRPRVLQRSALAPRIWAT